MRCAFIILWLSAGMALSGCRQQADHAAESAPPKGRSDKQAAPVPTAGESSEPDESDSSPRVVMETSLGRVVMELYPAKAARTVENFLDYVDAKFYDGTVFHRVIPTFMIQGGGFEPGMKKKPTRPPITNEAKNGLENLRGSVAMARTNAPHSATSQFFINVQDNRRLDHPSFDGWGYCVFGKVVEGMDVVDKIRNVPTVSVGGRQAVPAEDVVILSVRRQ